jgi:peptide/nickel transport system permease protein
MLTYILRRIIIMIPTLIVISIISFIIIQLPPGDFLTTYIATLGQSGDFVDQAEIEALKKRYNLDKPMILQYVGWISGFTRGDFGYSFQWSRPVKDVIGDRLTLTLVVAIASMVFTWIVALPIGFYSAVRQYSLGDYFFTGLGFIGLSTPNFMLALILMYVGFQYFGTDVGGLFSREMSRAPWSFAKFVDLLKHLWIPMIVVGTAGTASIIRIMRANLLDELNKPYVVTARAKGVSETKLLLKYPVRIAINPFISIIGWLLPQAISATTITSLVLSLPTIGPVLLQALLSQDMYLAGTFIFFLAMLTVIGTLISDILLAIADPRIRYD